ncbi:MAG: hypothetical protein ACI8PZ_002844 [Myxococcota bacterium]|jgi:hypothetical protein
MWWTLGLLAGCGEPPAPADPPAAPVHVAAAPTVAAFNQTAVELGLPLHWVDDHDGDGKVGGDEIVVAGAHTGAEWVAWTEPESVPLALAVRQVVEHEPDTGGMGVHEARRTVQNRAELRAARSVVVFHDFHEESGKTRAFVRAMSDAGEAIERLYRQQLGGARHAAELAAGDALGRAVFERNHGPWCLQPNAQHCSAIPGGPPPERVGWYPDDLQDGDGWCGALAPELRGPFTSVRRQGGGLVAVNYADAWDGVGDAAKALSLAAAALTDPADAGLRDYLTAAARGFVTDDWAPADAAWVALAGAPGRWYVRAGPDEVYADPCGYKAAYHLVFGLVDPGAGAWIQRLEPLVPQLEARLAEHAGPTYSARPRSPALPDMVDVVLTAGDSRPPVGATLGHSLPNVGAYAGERTAVFTNAGRDPASVREARDRAASLLCDMTDWSDSPEPLQLGTVLHELAHGLGPDAAWTVDGRTLDEALGGRLASTWGELHAQTASFALAGWLGEQGQLDADLVRRARVADLVWAMGKVAERDASDPDPYAELSAIQLGEFGRAGAVRWDPGQTAANGADIGCFIVDHQAFPASADALATGVFTASATLDVAWARALVDQHADGGPQAQVLSERWSRTPDVAVSWSLRL